MAIAPIDLQTIFTQVDKVGKTQFSQQDGQSLQQALQGAMIQKKAVEHIREVNEAQNTGDGTEKVKDRGAEQGDHAGGRKRKNAHEETFEEEEKSSVLQDPSLGKNIDISL